MMKWKPAPVQVLIALNAMLLFLVLLADQLSVPVWLQVTGRLHPMILHFPIVLIVAYALCRWLTPKQGTPAAEWLEPFGDKLLLWAAFAAVLTALAGILLSKEASYEGSALAWHKWTGTLTSLVLLALLIGKDSTLLGKQKQKWIVVAPLGIVILTGHLGGDVTHGAGYVLAPIRSERPPTPPFDEAMVWADLVQPVIAARCMQCHNSGTTKGGLNMEDPVSFAKGGRNGKPWDTTAEGMGVLITRIHLPLEDKKHMPPANKTQLTEQEEKMLYAWVKAGAPFDKKVIELAPADTLRLIAARMLRSDEEEHFDFPAADDKKVAALRTNYRAITPLATGSAGLAVDFYGAGAFQSKQLEELSPIREQIVSLNLNKMPVTDNDLSHLAAFSNLRQLNLDFTRITGAGLSSLAKLSHLQSLSLSGTAIKGEDLKTLTTLSSLRKLYLWKTSVDNNSIAQIKAQRKDLQLITGFNADTVKIKLNPPRLETEARIIRDTGIIIRMRHYVPGATIRYTVDGSDPDSGGKVYSKPFPMQDRGFFRAKAYKPGWLASDPVTANFYLQKFPPDSIHLLLPIDSNYMKFKPTVLIDADKGDLGFGSGKWLGFHKNGLAAILYYQKPATIKDITFSSLVDVGSEIFPPTDLEVWGGPDEHHLKRLGTMTPSQPNKLVPSYMIDYRIDFPPTTVRCIKVVANHVQNLPDWHPNKEKPVKGKPVKEKPAWVFFDELLVN
ncbi:MAG TPA: FN3 associated domain-containing protein [Puia sp.]